jgi:hypothetical protein
MTTARLLPPLLLLLAPPALPAYDAPGDDFRIAFPGPPSVEATAADGAAYRVADGDTTYVVRRLPCGQGCAEEKSDAAFYDDFQQQGVAALKGTLQAQRPVTAGARAGREFVIHAVGKKTGRPYEMTSRAFRVGGDVYVASATTPREAAARARARAVLDSFVLLK